MLRLFGLRERREIEGEHSRRLWCFRHCRTIHSAFKFPHWYCQEISRTRRFIYVECKELVSAFGINVTWILAGIRWMDFRWNAFKFDDWKFWEFEFSCIFQLSKVSSSLWKNIRLKKKMGSPCNQVNKWGKWDRRRKKQCVSLFCNAPYWLNIASYFDIAISPEAVFPAAALEDLKKLE